MSEAAVVCERAVVQLSKCVVLANAMLMEVVLSVVSDHYTDVDSHSPPLADKSPCLYGGLVILTLFVPQPQAATDMPQESTCQTTASTNHYIRCVSNHLVRDLHSSAASVSHRVAVESFC